MLVEERAQALDHARKVRILKSEDIDTEKYLKAHDVTHKVHGAETWLEEIRGELTSPAQADISTTLPWPKTHSHFRFRPGEVTLYAGSNGGGKSLVTGQIALGLVKQDQRVCVASFEMKPKRSLLRMLRQFAGENIDAVMFSDRAAFINRLLDRMHYFSRNRLWFYDQQGSTSSKEVIAMARYCAIELGIQHVFIDSLMKCVAAEDDFNGQKMFVDELTALARDHNIHVHLVHHIRKQSSDDVQPNKHDIKGTGAITDQVDNVLLMWRNKKKEQTTLADETQPDAILACEKQRNGEAEEKILLWYHKDSQQYLEANYSVPMAFDDVGDF